MKEELTIVKVGGKIVEDKLALHDLINKFTSLRGPKILVHGGGRSATRMAERLGIESQMVNGRRVTDKEMLDIVTMVYGGLVNKNIVALLQASQVNAIGLTGVDGNAILSHRREVKSVDYGYVGDVDQVNALLLSQLIYSELIPVMAPLTHNGKGDLLNTNADTIAASCAIGLSEFFDVRLIFCFEKRGVLLDTENENSVIANMNQVLYEKYKTEGIIDGGMIPKLDNSFDALKKGVKEVIITSAELLGSNKGTHISLA